VKNILKLAFIFSFLLTYCYSQIVYVPVGDEVYDFLDRMATKKIIKISDEVLPFSRIYIARKIQEIEYRKEELNDVEKELLIWYMREFSYELNIDIRKRYRLFSYEDSLFQLQVSPIVGYKLISIGKNNGTSRMVGMRAFSTIGDNFGINVEFRDSGEFGDIVDDKKDFTSQTGYDAINADAGEDGIEFSDIKGSMNYSWHWGDISFNKDYMLWGHGKFGNLILSDKAASFPFIRFTLYPAEWIRFNYFHGWINSLVIDSAKTLKPVPNSLLQDDKETFIKKYIVANLLTFSVNEWWDFSMGNSFVYSGDFRVEMLIPFMFFKYLDRDSGQGAINDGNGQFYFDTSIRYFKDLHLYSTIFFDVTEITKILKGEQNNTWFGFTLGAKTTNLIFNNLDLLLEYTRINPWVYEHRNVTTTYKHLDYVMGHWLGQNADQLRIQLNYQPIRGLKVETYFERLRKGDLLDVYFAYEDDEDEPFLYGENRKDITFGLDVSYEFVHELFVLGHYKYSDISDEKENRTQDFLLGKKNYLSLGFRYGIW
jgi:hypothetical protein